MIRDTMADHSFIPGQRYLKIYADATVYTTLYHVLLVSLYFSKSMLLLKCMKTGGKFKSDNRVTLLAKL